MMALISAGADVNAGFNTPLHLAAAIGSSEVAEVLLEAGADIGARDDNGATPLHRAAAEGDPGVVSLLLKAGADANARDWDERSPWDVAEERGENDDDFLFSDGYWLLHKASLRGGRLDDGDLEPVAVPAPATPTTGPRLDREEPRDGGWGWLLAVVGAIVSVFLVLLSWTFEASD